ncbi:hypothetical protein ECSTECS1191_3525 [Escherichia coli STEC_S1191]|nr:hypothetical protein ECSTECS1191_3525 [Escherichia coli STEC_S1191]
MKSLPIKILYVYTVARNGKRWEEKMKISFVMYVHDIETN